MKTSKWGKWQVVRVWSTLQNVPGEPTLSVRVRQNSRYTVLIRECQIPDVQFGTQQSTHFYHLSVYRSDGKPVHRWYDLQRIKNELIGPRAEAIEIYPAESRLVDRAHVYHLWVWTGVRIPIGPTKRKVTK